MKDLVLNAMNVLCVLTRHAGACAVFNGRVGQRILRWGRCRDPLLTLGILAEALFWLFVIFWFIVAASIGFGPR